ncbi:MAG: glycosyltransferase [Chitinophagaceae bacterium]|nr:glycosyltransferase [Chitinophagaceae bacterium]
MTKVVQLTYNLTSAGKQAIRLHNEFRAAGIDSTLISLYSASDTENKVYSLGRSYKLIEYIDKKIQKSLTKRAAKEYGMFSYPVIGSNVAKLEQVRQADFIYLHWVMGGFLSLGSIEQLAKLNKPVVIVLHDMWPITGGCHYSFKCENYKSHCENCQIFRADKNNHLPEKEFKKKFKLYSGYKNIFFVSPSIWLYECAKESGLTKEKEIFYVPNIVDEKIYKTVDRETARKILNLSNEEIIIGFGAVAIDSPYKGWNYFEKALENLSDRINNERISVLIFGKMYQKNISKKIPFKTKFLGYLHDDYSMAIAYNSLNVFVVPSVADNLPTTIFESLSCGVPVVSFKTGGIPDLIMHKFNGYLAKERDADDLAIGIEYCINNDLKGHILPVFQAESTINKHIELFKYFDALKV